MHGPVILVYMNKFRTFYLEKADGVLDPIHSIRFSDCLGKFASSLPAFFKLCRLTDTFKSITEKKKPLYWICNNCNF